MTQAHTPLLLGGPNASTAKPSEAWTRLQLRLRGRFILLAAVAVVVAVLCAAAGYFSWSPRYESVAQIRVSPILQRILFRSDENGVLPMYDGYIESQVALMQSANVLTKAAEAPAWKSLSPTDPDEALREMASGLRVRRGSGSQVITVSFTSRTALKSTAGVNAIVDAYMTTFSAQESKDEATRVSVLEQRRTSLMNELRTLRERVMTIASEYGSDRLDTFYQAKLNELARIDGTIRQLQIDRAQAEVAVEMEDKTGLATSEIAQRDRTMQAYIEQKKQAEWRLSELRLRYADNHAMVVQARQGVTNLDQLIADYAKEYNAARLKGATIDPAGGGSPRDLELLRARLKKIQEVQAEAQAEALELGRKNLQLSELRAQIDQVKDRLRETDQRLEQINVEAPVRGRVNVIASATEPLSPSNGKSRIQYTVLGGLGGFALTAGLIIGLTLMDRRYQHVEEARMSGANRRLLGVLPRLPDDLADPEQASISAACVHQIRSLLQLGPEAQRRSVFLITSAAPGDGKTSLATALALSFAGGGARTLLIDLDLRGRGMTAASQTITLDRLGQILLRQGLITATQLQEGLDRARTSSKLLGDALIDLGLITAAQRDAALDAQSHLRRGVLSVLDGTDIERCISPTSVEGLSVLPIGSGGTDRVLGLSPQIVGRLIDEARKRFPIVVIDSGPVPGCVESSLAAAQVDAVVFTLSRGSRREPTERALAHLDSIGATIAGMVFNRAGASDVDVYSSSYYSVSRRRRLPTIEGALASGDDQQYGLMGPVALATARGMRRTPATEEAGAKA